MGFVVFLICFLTVRFILQMVFLKDCPNCGKTVSIDKSRECPGCGYMFLKNRQMKLNAAIALLVIAVIGFCFLDVYYFRKETSQYYLSNPYLWRGEMVSSTEVDAPAEEIAGSISEEAPADSDANPVAGVLGDLFRQE